CSDMPSLITDTLTFGGNCEPDATPPPGWQITAADPPPGMASPQWDAVAQQWIEGPQPPPYAPPLSLSDLIP
ncbi:MAG: hypothetical protein ACHWZW_22335, partial [Spirulina sp.]